MVTLTILYPFSADAPFDEDYFADTHIPLLQEVWGAAVMGVTVHHALAGLDGDPAFSTFVQIDFADMEAFQHAMAQPRTAQLNADVANFAGVTPLMQLSRIAG